MNYLTEFGKKNYHALLISHIIISPPPMAHTWKRFCDDQSAYINGIFGDSIDIITCCDLTLYKCIIPFFSLTKILPYSSGCHLTDIPADVKQNVIVVS